MYMNTGKKNRNAVTIYALGGLDSRGGTYNPLVSWTAHSGHTYMSAGTLGAHIYFIPVGWTAPSGPTYMLAGMLGVCIYFIPVGWTAHSGCTYMSAGMLGAPIYFIPVGWTTPSGPTYMSAGMLGAPIYFIPVGWTAHSGPGYMLAGMHGSQMIIPGPRHYMQLKDIISAEIGWNATCRHLTHMKIHLKRKILTEACVGLW